MSGAGRTYKRGKAWWVDYSFRGKRYRESTGSHRKGDATQLLRKRLAEMGQGKLVGPSEERLVFADLERLIRDDYAVHERKSTQRLNSALNALRAHFGKVRVVDITPNRVSRYIASRKAEGRANSTIRNELNALRRAMRIAKRVGLLSTVPEFDVPRVTAVRQGFVDEPDLRALLAELPDYLHGPTLFAWLTGWRRGEVFGLTWAQVDFDAGIVRLEPGTTKNLQGREFPFWGLPELAALLEAQRDRARELGRRRGEFVTLVFHRDGKPLGDHRKAWAQACERAGLAGLVFHDLRRSAVRNLERAGVPRSTAMRLTGHKTEAVYRRYAIVDSVMIEEGVQKLARLVANGGKARTVLPMTVAAQG